MRICVTGGRDYFDYQTIYAALGALHREHRITVLAHGCCEGADYFCGQWAKRNFVREVRYPADWTKHGKAAGPIRNREMLDAEKPAMLVAFHGGSGTRSCVRLAEERGIKVHKVTAEQNMGNIGSTPNSAGSVKSGSKGSVGPSTPKSACAAAGAAKISGGAKPCGSTGGKGPMPNASGSKGNG